MNKFNFLFAAALLLIASISQAAEVVGTVGYMSGSLVAKRADGTVKIMGTKSDVLAGDVLGTAKDSYAQIQMNDGARITLRPNSNLKIVDYHFNKQEPNSDTAVFSLLKGGLRSVTGLIGKRGDPDAYKMQTKVATVGIRGTDFSARLCETENCQEDVTAPAKLSLKPQVMPLQVALHTVQSLSVWKILALPLKAMMTSAVADDLPATSSPPGLYVTVHSGQVIVAQPTGNALSLGRGETGFANTAALIRLPAPPAFMKVDTKQTNAIEAKTSRAATSSGSAGTSATTPGAAGGKASGSTEAGKASGSPEAGRDSGSHDTGRDSGSHDAGRDSGSSDAGRDSGSHDTGRDSGSHDTGRDSGSGGSDAGRGGGSTDTGRGGGSPDSVSPDTGSAASPNPSVNRGGCVVQ